ncbi:MAG: hypothetical protein RL077_6450 [Verrucomicrobiota bacterium]
MGAPGGGGRGGGVRFPYELMLPNPQHAPAAGAEGAGAEAVAGAVGGKLFLPEGGVGFRRRGVERVAVPKAAVDEDGEAVHGENQACRELRAAPPANDTSTLRDDSLRTSQPAWDA